MKRALILLLLAAALLASLATAQTPKPTKAELRSQTFEIVWQSVKDHYYDPTFGGVDWDAVKLKYAPKIESAKTDAEFHGLLNAMLGELKQSHFAVIPPSVYLAEADRGKGERDADAGMVVQFVEGKPTVVRVEPGYPAAAAGIKPGFIVEQIGKIKPAEIVRSLKALHEPPGKTRFLLAETSASLLTGKPGQIVEVKVLDGKNKPKTTKLKLKKSKGESIKLGELPALYGYVESKLLPGKIGYVTFNIFLMPLLPKVQDAIAKFKQVKGLKGVIVDLRMNPGGVGAMAVPIARNFLAKEINLGTMKMRGGEVKMRAVPGDDPLGCPLAVLTDEGSASTSEIFAGGLQECGRAFTVGGTTAGAALPSTFVKLPDGSRLQSAFADFKTPKGVLLEGRGVFADFPVTLTRKALLTGRDPVLDKAVAVLLRKAKKGK
jgi:carboxyl-terminal processing protease